MPYIDAAGIQINFPFEPYPCQVDYMKSVIQCLQQGQNGILESPTGTGKTLCLLCSSLAWLETKKAQISSKRWKMAQAYQEDPGKGAVEFYEEYRTQLADQLDQAAGDWAGEMGAPRIIYASRTHSQLTQAIQEMKRTSYRHFRVSVLGSREQLCIHPQVMKETSNTTKVHLCRAKVQARSCYFYNNVENGKGNFTNQVLDIEDLTSLGEKHKCCPYYIARELKTEADIIFLPYNYLLDPKSRKAHSVELQGNIVIFDEAHNLEKICEDSTSFDLSSTDIAGAIRDLSDLSAKIMEMVGEGEISGDMGSEASIGEDFTLKEVLELKAMLHHLEQQVDSIPLPRPKEGVTKPGKFIFELFDNVNLNFSNKSGIAELLDKLVTYLTSENTSGFHSRGASLSKISDVIKIVFSRDPADFVSISGHQNAISKHYKVHIHEEKKKPTQKKVDTWASNAKPSESSGRVISYWCFSPGHAMEDLRAHGVRCIVLTSGTLSPLSSFTAEMGIQFPVQLENPHVIEKHQMWVGTVGRGPDNTLLSSAYDHRFREDYQASLGNAVVNFSRVVPNGLLLFFPSYPVMDKCLEHWQRNNIWNRIEQHKPVFVEPRGKHEFQSAMQNFYDKINDPALNGAVFAAVCRGKVSEGLDFSDINGRAVVITGLPYPPRMDPKVMLKMEFLDEMKKTNPKGLCSRDWYKQQASRAVNQAIGRVIRHKQDFGAIILCDHRFSKPDALAQLPVWVRPHVNHCDNFGLAIRDVMMFFRTAEKVMPAPAPSRSRQRLAEAGCQGAHFAPTVTRSSVKDIYQASKVEQHVPSLKRNKHAAYDDKLAVAKLKIQYEGEVQTRQRGSLLDVLSDQKPRNFGLSEQLSESQLPSYQQELKKSQAESRNKKKIVLKNPSKPDVKAGLLISAEAYIAEVKKTLSNDGYQLFSKTLTQYKKTGDYDAMVTVLAGLFTDNPNNYHLFAKFYRFVRSHDKSKFNQTCHDLTGQTCETEKVSNGARKRPTPSEDESGSKKRKAENQAASKSSGQTGAVQGTLQGWVSNKTSRNCHTTQDNKDRSAFDLDIFNKVSSAGTSLNSQAGHGRTSTDKGSVIQNKVTVTKPHEQVEKCSNSGITSDVQRHSARDTTLTPGGQKENENSDVKESLLSAGKEGAADNVSKPVSTALTSEDVANVLASSGAGKSGYCCRHCKKEAVVPLKAKCQHVCCMECWKVCIRDTRQCPACHQAVKRKHLSRLFFPSGPGCT